MPKVYIVLIDDWENDGEISEVFSTEEKAQSYADWRNEQYGFNAAWVMDYEVDSFDESEYDKQR